MGLSDYDRAAQAFLRAIELNPKMPAAGFQLCRVYMKQQKYAEALQVLQGMLKAKTKTAMVHRMIGDIYTIQTHYKQAVEEYNAVLLHSRGLQEKYPELKEIENSGGDDEARAMAFQTAFEKIFAEIGASRKMGDGEGGGRGRGGRGGRGGMMKKRARRMH